MMRLAFPALLVFLAMAGFGLAAGQPLADKYDSDQHIHITSDRLEADDATFQVKFLGNVVVRQGDAVIYAEEVTIFFQSESREIERAEAYRDVRIVQGTRVATGQKAIFYGKEGRIVITGSPRLHQGEDYLEGDEITVFLNEERCIVNSGEGSRVNAVFHPKGDQQ
jgi:lipopolysaccharide export system protein LptA